MSLIKYKQYLMLLAMVGVCLGLNYWLEEQINPYVIRVIINCGIACILALSLNLISGCAGQFSLGHAGFMAVGAYFSSYLTTVLALPEFFHGGMGSQLCILMGGIAAGFAGYLVGLPSLRLRGDYLAIVTLGFGEVIRIVFLNIETLGGARGLPSIPRTANFFWVSIWLIITFVFLYRLIRSSYGRAILSIRENEIAAESMGIDVSKYKIIAFVFSSFFAGIAGGLFAHTQGFIDPSGFNFNRSVDVVIMVVIGGMGSFSGSIIGAIIVTVLPELLRVFENYRMIIFPTLLILLMLLRPMGIFGHKEIWSVFNFRKKKASLMEQLMKIKGGSRYGAQT